MNRHHERAYARHRYARLKAAGLCVACGATPPTQGRVKCQDCAKSNAALVSKARKRKSDACGHLGVCKVCLDREAMPGLRWCGVCAEQHTEHMANLRQRRRDAGKCTRCGREPEPGYRMCPECQAHQRAKGAAYRERMKRRKAA